MQNKLLNSMLVCTATITLAPCHYPQTMCKRINRTELPKATCLPTGIIFYAVFFSSFLFFLFLCETALLSTLYALCIVLCLCVLYTSIDVPNIRNFAYSRFFKVTERPIIIFLAPNSCNRIFKQLNICLNRRMYT